MEKMLTDLTREDLVLVLNYLIACLYVGSVSDSNVRRSIRVLQSVQRREGFEETH